MSSDLQLMVGKLAAAVETESARITRLEDDVRKLRDDHLSAINKLTDEVHSLKLTIARWGGIATAALFVAQPAIQYVMKFLQ